MSLMMTLTRGLLRFIPKTTQTAATAYENAEKRSGPAPVTAAARKVAIVEESTVDGFPVIRLTPRSGATGDHLVYTHGGCYVYPILATHWNLVARIIRDTGVTVTVPLYGLAPGHQVDEAYALLERVYDGIDAERVFLAGDSAGGGLALGQALHYRDTGRRAPAGIVLFSPWVDITLADAEADALVRLDPMIAPAGLRAAGSWWAGELDPHSPLVSPLYGDLAGLPPVHTFQGGRDILAPDAESLTRALRAAGTEAELELFPTAFHVFVGAPWTPEAQRALRRVAEILGG
jgi:acetyl esterase/lipase